MCSNGEQPEPVREKKRIAALAYSLPPYRRPREYPDYLAMELVNDDELQLRMDALCWVYNQAAAHRTARVCREDLTVDGLHFAPEVMSWPLLPRSRNT